MGSELDSAVETVKYKTCTECGGQCCKFFVIPAPKMKNPDYEKYFALRVPGARFMETKRHGRIFVINIPCKNLKDGRCVDYENRPKLCRDMNDFTLYRFCVPRGCKYDKNGEFGEDFLNA